MGKIRVLVENGVDSSVGDYDQRTVSQQSWFLFYFIGFISKIHFQAAHLAASNGKISVLDFLLSQVNSEYILREKMERICNFLSRPLSVI